jgi:hypothetical protein
MILKTKAGEKCQPIFMKKKYYISTDIEERGTVHHTDPGQKKSAVTGAGNSETASLLWTSIAGKTVIHITAGPRGAAVWKEEAVWIEEKMRVKDDLPAETSVLLLAFAKIKNG